MNNHRGLIMIKLINVRFFTYCTNDDNEPDICEISEAQFLKLKLIQSRFQMNVPIIYERHTMFKNGCAQICLTLPNEDYPHIDEL